jgi:hypothetical protein
MRRRSQRAAILALLLAGLPVSALAQSSIAEQYLFSAVNSERAHAGLRPLLWNNNLYIASHGHCLEMASRASISHQYADEAELTERGRRAGARFSEISENVAEAPTAVRIHDAWMNSPGHRANILDPRVDSIGISVIRRDGQLYAVQDFDRSVANLSLSDQEDQVVSLLTAAAALDIIPTSEETRRTCQMDTGYAGAHRPLFIMRYTAGDLTRLPDLLTTRLATGQYHHAEVGACTSKQQQAFTAFNIAVMLYP